MSDERKPPKDVEAFFKALTASAEALAKNHGLELHQLSAIVKSPSHPGAREHRGKEWLN